MVRSEEKLLKYASKLDSSRSLDLVDTVARGVLRGGFIMPISDLFNVVLRCWGRCFCRRTAFVSPSLLLVEIESLLVELDYCSIGDIDSFM